VLLWSQDHFYLRFLQEELWTCLLSLGIEAFGVEWVGNVERVELNSVTNSMPNEPSDGMYFTQFFATEHDSQFILPDTVE